MDVGDTDVVQYLGRRQVGGLGSVVHRTLQGGQRRQPHTNALVTHYSHHGLGDFAQEPQALEQGSPIAIGARIGLRVDELVNQVAIGAM
ncbi:hypothetical protein D3C81_1781640 [compost metagenome]